MLTFKTLFEEAQKVDPDDTIHVTVGVWRIPPARRFGTEPLIEGKWEIWSANRSKHYSGSSPEAALEAYRLAVNPPSDAPLDLALVDDACQIDLGGEGGGA